MLQDTPERPALGQVDFGDLRRGSPISSHWGFDRGKPIDRYYIDEYLRGVSPKIAGRVLEFGNNSYTRLFGGTNVAASDVINHDATPGTTVVADLERAGPFPVELYDCIICTQTLHLIYAVEGAMRRLRDALVPGGSLLVTVPGITKADHEGPGVDQAWSFTPIGLSRLAAQTGPWRAVEVDVRGNVFAAVAFLHGLAVADVRETELDPVDPLFPVIICGHFIRPYANV